ncbi:hypothetical protein [Paraburkholderia sp. BL21I4N1]|uniref:hypothetical protein n=1 Tax=Paraburkholderia sp. BL21I4N1 TaxID=1938801 RepID=UPI000CFBA19E|nr:hypothetical protein [Paraburkholderia sp. BL21I4N1]PQV51851.1 hypothetical protein B0G83_10460 [Paraburkholderia sp. BL21I4N1]
MAKRIVGINDRGLRVGQDHQRAKLTDAAVEMIRRLHEDGVSYRVIAIKFEISKTQVCYICTYMRRAQTAARFRAV